MLFHMVLRRQRRVVSHSPPSATPWPIEKEAHTEHGNEGATQWRKRRHAALDTPAPHLGTRTGTADPVGNAGVNRANACAASVILSSGSVPLSSLWQERSSASHRVVHEMLARTRVTPNLKSVPFGTVPSRRWRSGRPDLGAQSASGGFCASLLTRYSPGVSLISRDGGAGCGSIPRGRADVVSLRG